MRYGTAVLLVVFLAAPQITAATFTRNAPTTTNNDDSCDIGLYPAATLLLPHFEVSDDPGGVTTLVSITNTGRLPQAIRLTLWTDYGYPVMSFPMYLTGYDVQTINLYDLIWRGRIAPDNGTGSDVSAIGELSGPTAEQSFDNPQLNEASCTNLVVQLPRAFILRMAQAFTAGEIPAVGALPECARVGGPHQNAIGYATIDVTVACGDTLPTETAYFTAEIGYDNVLTGDYVQLDQENELAQGGPLVHIRAVPEGGNPSTHRPTNLSRTFYSRLQPAVRRTLDARQPLPSVFAARWIHGGVTGMNTTFKIWREVDTAANATCDLYANNDLMRVAEVVRFDEDENPETAFSVPVFTPPVPGPTLAATTHIGFDRGDVLPPNSTAAAGGWIYFNLDSDELGDRASQNWVVVTMSADGKFSVDSDATALGNGCTAPAVVSNANDPRGQPIGPGPDRTP